MADQITPEQEQLADDAAKAIVDAARAMYPDNPVKQAECAMYAALHLQAIWPGTRVSAESPGLSAVELEDMISGARVPWRGRQ